MRLLLDTHVLLWAVAAPERLSPAARQAILDPESELLVSIASLWEIAIKQSIGRLALSADWPSALDRERAALGARWLPIRAAHCLGVASLPFHHRDPFDRMLIAQALAEDLSLVSADQHLRAYPREVIW